MSVGADAPSPVAQWATEGRKIKKRWAALMRASIRRTFQLETRRDVRLFISLFITALVIGWETVTHLIG